MQGGNNRPPKVLLSLSLSLSLSLCHTHTHTHTHTNKSQPSLAAMGIALRFLPTLVVSPVPEGGAPPFASVASCPSRQNTQPPGRQGSWQMKAPSVAAVLLETEGLSPASSIHPPLFPSISIYSFIQPSLFPSIRPSSHPPFLSSTHPSTHSFQRYLLHGTCASSLSLQCQTRLGLTGDH